MQARAPGASTAPAVPGLRLNGTRTVPAGWPARILLLLGVYITDPWRVACIYFRTPTRPLQGTALRALPTGFFGYGSPDCRSQHVATCCVSCTQRPRHAFSNSTNTEREVGVYENMGPPNSRIPV